MCGGLKGRKHSALPHQKQKVANMQKEVGGFFDVSVWLNKNRPALCPRGVGSWRGNVYTLLSFDSTVVTSVSTMLSVSSVNRLLL